MKKLSAVQLKVIIAFNLAIIVILGGIFLWYIPTLKSTPASAAPDKPEYKRSRTAQISLNPYLGWELDLIGTDTEEVVFTYANEANDILYIFGNTTSRGGDFDRPGVFLSAIDAYGRTGDDSFFIYGAETDLLKSATLAEGGFLLAIDGALPYLLLVGFDGAVKARVEGFLTMREAISSVRQYKNGYLLFTAPEYGALGIKRLRCIFFDFALTYKGHSLATAEYSLEPFEITVISGKPVALCNGVSSLNTVPCAISFAIGSFEIEWYSKYPGAATDMAVADGDIVLLTAYGGSSLIILDALLKIKDVRHLSQLSPRRLVYLDDNFFAAYLYGSTHVLNIHLASSIVYADFAAESVEYLGSAAFVAGSSANAGDTVTALKLQVYKDGRLCYSADIGGGEAPFVQVTRRHVFCVFRYGGGISVASLRYPIF